MTQAELKKLRQAQEESTCRRQKVGAIILDHDGEILALGSNKCQGNFCIREDRQIPSCTRRDECFGSHAEIDAAMCIRKELHNYRAMKLICTHKPCATCLNAMKTLGVTDIEYLRNTPDTNSHYVAMHIGLNMKEVIENDIR